jgi:short-subunit dehydrogenase
VAIITGASSGLGREYALWADTQGYDQIWLVARREERLRELATSLSTESRWFSLDLAERGSATRLADELRRESDRPDFQVALLVNAAGFGKFANVEEMSLEQTDALVDLNCRAVADVTRVCLPYLGRGSRVLQLASCAAFQPLPGLDLYAASKAFVLSYTRGLRLELQGRGIRITAVCPIWVRTEFNKVARSSAGEGQTTVRHTFPNLSPRHVVRWSWRINSINYPVATCAVSSFVMRIAGKVLPAPVVMGVWQLLRRL